MTNTDHLDFLGKEPASVTMGIRQLPLDMTDEISYTQQVQPWQRNGEGAVTLPSFSALIDTSVGSAAYQFSGLPGTEWVVSRLSVTCAPWAPVSEPLVATGRCEYVDHVTGTASARAEVSSGSQFLASVSCRSVSVQRPRLDENDVIPEMGTADASDTPSWTGPISDQLGLSAASAADDSANPPSLRWEPQSWMSNGLGTAQGGLVLAVVAAGAESAGEAITGDGVRVAISDLNLDILRSPQISAGTEYRVISTTVRQGRRLIVQSTDIVDTDEKVLARGSVTLLTRVVSD